MLEIKVPHYYRKFRCSADKCSDTCCAGWQIVVDEKTMDKYQSYEGPFGNRLANSVDWKEGVFYQYRGRCAFLDENNLCDIYTEAGPEMLCKTCRNYPRHIEEFENIREISLALSCPEAAKLILDTEEPVTFVTKEKEWKEELYENFVFFLFSKLQDAREIMIRMLQDRSRPVSERMCMCLAFVHDLQARIYRGHTAGMEDVFERYTKPGAEERFSKRLDPYRSQPQKRAEFFEKAVKELQKLEVLRASWPLLLEEIQEITGDEKLHQRWLSADSDSVSLEIMAENLMVYYIFTYFCGAVYDDQAYAKCKFAVIGTMVTLEAAKVLWNRAPQLGKKGAVLEAAKRYSREVEHSDENLELLEKLAGHAEVFELKNLLPAILDM
ncbi:MAG: flagellin lysine-N-methylase [Lachnospiraceae bacterium]